MHFEEVSKLFPDYLIVFVVQNIENSHETLALMSSMLCIMSLNCTVYLQLLVDDVCGDDDDDDDDDDHDGGGPGGAVGGGGDDSDDHHPDLPIPFLPFDLLVDEIHCDLEA